MHVTEVQLEQQTVPITVYGSVRPQEGEDKTESSLGARQRMLAKKKN